MSLPFRLQYTDGAQLLGQHRSNWLGYDQDSSGQPVQSPHASLGGTHSLVPLANLGVSMPQVQSVYQGRPPSSPLPWRAGEEDYAWFTRLFRDVSAAQRTAGAIHHRCIAILPSTDEEFSDFTSVKAWVTQPAGATVRIGQDPGSLVATTVATETDVPAGVSFSLHGAGAKLDLGPLPNTPSSFKFLWIQREVSAGAASRAYDKAVIHLSAENADGNIWYGNVVVFFTLRTDAVAEVEMEGYRDDEVLDLSGDVYTVTLTDSAGAAVDPAGSKVWALLTLPRDPGFDTSIPDAPYGPWPSQAGTMLAQLTRTAAGTYRWEFRPMSGGHYHLTLDCGGEFTYQRHLEVSPVAV